MPPAHAARRTNNPTSRRILAGLIAVAVLFAVGRLAVEVADRVGTAQPGAAVVPAAVAKTTTSTSTGTAAAERLMSPSARAAPSRPTDSAAAPPALSPRTRHWQRVLGSLDRIRAQAWRQTRPGLLRQVYLPSAAEGERDRSMLRKYAARELRVLGVSLAFGSVRVAHRVPGAVRLRVVDQLRAATAVGKQGRRLELPRDRPTRHTIELRWFRGGWRIADVRVR